MKFKKARTVYGCTALFAFLFILSTTIVSYRHTNYRPDNDADVYNEMEIMVSWDGRSSLYRFANGEIGTVQGHLDSTDSLPSDQHLASMTLTSLWALYKRLLLEPTANCFMDGRSGSSKSLCIVGPLKPQTPCFSFLFSDNGTREFEDAIATSLDCQVLVFDPGMRQASHMRSDRLLLLREGLSSTVKNGTIGSRVPTDSYLGYLIRFGAHQMVIDVLKFDIGPHELPALEAAVRDGSLKNVKQLVLRIRIKSGKAATAEQLLSCISVLRGIHKLGFRRWHSHNASADLLNGSLSYINANYLIKNINQPVRNPPGSQIALPLESLVISKAPGHKQFDILHRRNLSAMTAVQLEILYFDLIEQQHMYCPLSRRIGNVGDGGWDVCFSKPFSIVNTGRPCIALSFGINYIWEYDDQLADMFHCQVHMFDPSMNKVKNHQRRNSSWFYRTGLSSSNRPGPTGWKMRTLCQLFQDLGYSNKTIDILKIDIEYWEWEVFETAMKDGCLKQVKQLLFETHTFNVYQPQRLARYAHLIRILMGVFDLGFRTWKWHKNPASIFYKSNSGLTRACCYELYMLNTHFIS